MGHVPKWEEHEKDVVVYVPEIVETEEIIIKDVVTVEEKPFHVPEKIVTEKAVIDVHGWKQMRVEDREETLRVELPSDEVVVEKPKVLVEEKIDYVKATETLVIKLHDEDVEVPYIVMNPNLVPCPKQFVETVMKEEVITH